MNTFQKILYDLYGKKLESIGFSQMQNFWYKISRSGIASFVGTRRFSHGDLEFWAASQPVFSDFCTQIDNISIPPQTYFNMCFFPTGDSNVIYHNQVTAKSLINDEKIRFATSECITRIIDAYFLKGFSSDMSISECLEINDIYMNICLENMNQKKNIWKKYTYTQIEMMLFLHINYDICYEFYKSLSGEWLLNSIHMQFAAENAEKEEENCRLIEEIISSYENIAPTEYIRMCIDNGMCLKQQYREQDYINRINWVRNIYKILISLIESDDYNGIMDYLEQKHEKNNKECQCMFKCNSLPFSCYLK